MLRKFKAAWTMLRRQGIGAVWVRAGWYYRRWRTSDNWWLGRLVELRGNIGRLDGCTFDLSHPAIGTAQKAGFFWGNYEDGERQALRHIPADGLPVIELGGSIGAMACVSSRHFGNPAQHVVVEANPNLMPVLRRSRDLNGCRFEIVHAALAYGGDEVTFHVHPKFVKSSLLALDGQAAAVRVPAVTLGGLLDRFGFKRLNLFCDIEGAEVALFDHEFDLVAARVKYLSLEIHPYLTGAEAVESLLARLAGAGFRELYRHKFNLLFVNERL
jgi:FkbM family methyltransferase